MRWGVGLFMDINKVSKTKHARNARMAVSTHVLHTRLLLFQTLHICRDLLGVIPVSAFVRLDMWCFGKASSGEHFHNVVLAQRCACQLGSRLALTLGSM